MSPEAIMRFGVLLGADELTGSQRQLWNEAAPDLGAAIIHTIRKMGLPAPGAGPANAPGLAATFHSQVRTALLCDVSMHADILQETATAFWSAARRGTLPADVGRGWIFCVLQRTTWRHATARAEHLLLSLESKTDEAAVNRVPAASDPEREAGNRQMVERLGEAVGELGELEQRILKAKLDDEYDALAHELGVTSGSLRVRAHRLCRRLRAAVEGSVAVKRSSRAQRGR